MTTLSVRLGGEPSSVQGLGGGSPGRLWPLLSIVLLDALAANMMPIAAPGLLERLDDAGAQGAFGQLIAIFAAAQFVAQPVFGALSDRWGRRPVMLASIAALALDYVVAACASHIAVLFLSRLIAGLCAGNFTVAFASAGDGAPDAQRAHRFGLVSAAFGLGAFLGPLLGAAIADHSVRGPYWLAASLSLVSLLTCLVALPRQRPGAPRPPTGAIGPAALLELLREPALRGLGVTFLAGQVAKAMVITTWLVFTLQALAWSKAAVAAAMAAMGLGQFLVQALLSRRVQAFGLGRTVLATSLLSAAGYALLLWGRPLPLAVAIALGALGGLVTPALKAMASGRAADDRQGGLHGLFGALSTLGWAIGAGASGLILAGGGANRFACLFGVGAALSALAPLALAAGRQHWPAPSRPSVPARAYADEPLSRS